MAILKCKMCGGNLEIEEGMTVCECEYCGSKQTIPNIDSEKIIKLYDRANRLRRANEFDKAYGVYESIIEEVDTEAEAYWGLILCKYGIEYVTDPVSGDKVPTCHRVSFDSVLEDENFELIMENADMISRNVYREQAKQIEEIRKGIIEVSGKEEPYDIFICYKETDENGDRTIDSVMAQDTYDALTEKGYRVFFSRISLEDKLGQEYEPYIFAALNSAKIMLAFGTSYDYYNAVWVKNEWARFLKLMSQDKEKHLIPCYKDIDAYDIPKEFKHLQAQDMGKVGAIQDLIRGIDKLIGRSEKEIESRQQTVIQQVVSGGQNVEALLKRGYDALEDKAFEEAQTFFNDALNSNAQSAEAYLGLFMAQVGATDKEAAKKIFQESDFTENRYWKRAKQYADERMEEEFHSWEVLRSQYVQMKQEEAEQKEREEEEEKKRKEKEAKEKKKRIEEEKKNQWEKLKVLHEQLQLGKYELTEEEKALKDSSEIKEMEMLEESIATKKKQIANLGFFKGKEKKKLQEQKNEMEERLLKLTGKIEEKKLEIINMKRQSEEAIHLQIKSLFKKNRMDFPSLIRYGQDEEFIKDMRRILAHRETMVVGFNHTVGLKSDGRVVATGKNEYGECDVESWRDIVSVAVGHNHTVGLKSDGRVVATGKNECGECDVESWRDIVSVAVGDNYTVGLKSDGRVVVTGKNEYGECDVESWRDIVSVAAGCEHTVGLKSDGSVVATGENEDGQCNVDSWRDIVSVVVGDNYTVGLKSNGRVVATGYNEYGECDVDSWRGIVSVVVGDNYTVGLKSNGRVVATGYDEDGQWNVDSWRDIVSVAVGGGYTVGLKSDGSVVATGYDEDGQCDVDSWRDIVSVAVGDSYTVGLKSDGSVVATGYNGGDQCNVDSWTDIRLPS